MKVELSYLIGMDEASINVRHAHIGDAVYIEEIKENSWYTETLDKVKDDDEHNYNRIMYREELEFRPYSHRLFTTVDGDENSIYSNIDLVEKTVVRIISLSKVCSQNTIPVQPIVVREFQETNHDIYYEVVVHSGFYSKAYIVEQEGPIHIIEKQVEQMAQLWPVLKELYSDINKYKRIIRAFQTFVDAYHIYPAHLVHTTMHTALESLVCATADKNRIQVTKRLPQLVSISEAEAQEIYNFCIDVKHTAAPGLLVSPNLKNLDVEDAKRVKAASDLEKALRMLFIKAFSDKNFAEELADRNKLKAKYPV